MRLQEFDANYQIEFIESIRRDGISQVLMLFSPKLPLSEEDLQAVFVAAIESEAIEVSEYLRSL